jgi:hypothetical protein
MRDTGYDFDFAALETEDAAWSAYIAQSELALIELSQRASYKKLIQTTKLLAARDNLKLRQLLSLPLATRLHHIMQFQEILSDAPKDNIRLPLQYISSEYFSKYHLPCQETDEEAQNKYTQGKLVLLKRAEKAINTHCREKNNELQNKFRKIDQGHALNEMPSSADYLNKVAQDCQAFEQRAWAGGMGKTNQARREYYTQAAKDLWGWNEPTAYKYALAKSISDIGQQSAVAARDLTGCSPERFDVFSIKMVDGGAAQPMQFTKPEAGGEQPMQFTNAATHTKTSYDLDLELGRDIKQEIQQDLDEGFQAALDAQSADRKAPQKPSKLPSAAAGAVAGAAATTATIKAKVVAGAALALKAAAIVHPAGAAAVGACAVTAAAIKLQRKFRDNRLAKKPPQPTEAELDKYFDPKLGLVNFDDPFNAQRHSEQQHSSPESTAGTNSLSEEEELRAFGPAKY